MEEALISTKRTVDTGGRKLTPLVEPRNLSTAHEGDILALLNQEKSSSQSRIENRRTAAARSGTATLPAPGLLLNCYPTAAPSGRTVRVRPR